ncbi:Carboxylesterase NlhH [Rubripirellula lacrimiformis]|uniref:Carboxylesterase NlhH n=1 Tax=Rubripirellula lacrimiformis TaxID=1930273 RepID=A0A517NAW3_9BACT|nr:alpha/beta hydrolase [Rubripirellula lacrimiformis]QDT04274.1 Carboxylesterase NlhH [Rubripirellula lacrimiformis]
MNRFAPVFCTAIGLATTLFTGPLANGQAKGTDDVSIQRDVVYGMGGDVELHMDIATPAEASQPVPCIIVIHGGAWRQGDKSSHITQIRRFAQQGYVSATVQYRFCPQFPFPAQVEDVKCAVRYIRANAAKYGVDPTQIGAVGFSAGGHLAMMLGTMDAEDAMEGDGGNPDQSSKVQAVVSFYGPTLFTAHDLNPRTAPLVHDFLGGTADERPQAFHDASPRNYVTKGDAPMLLFQGTDDPLVPYTQAMVMVEAMTDADVPGRVEFLIDAGHGWGGPDLDRTIDETTQFFDRHLRGR